jgi:hypothetical protein
MNNSGKEWLTSRTADIINKLFAEQKPVPITLEWKESLMKRNQSKVTGYKESYLKIGQQEVRTSSWT